MEPSPPITTIENTTRLSRRRVRVELETVLVVDEQRARERGEEARDRERHQRVAARVHAVRARRELVLADGDEHAAGARPADAAHRDDRERRARRGRGSSSGSPMRTSMNAEEIGPLDARRREPVEAGALAEELRVEQPRRRHERERQRDHGDGEPASPQHRQPDQRGHRRADEPGAEQPEPEVPAPARGDRARRPRRRSRRTPSARG